MCCGQSPDQLTICVGEAVKLVLLLADLLLNPLDAVHRASILCDFRDQRLIANLYEGLIGLVSEAVVAVEAEQLLICIIRCGAMITNGGCMNITLVDDSPFIHAPPCHRVHSHANFDPLGCGDASSASDRDVERDVVLSAVTDEAVGSGG
jgi:hypothetical protein